MWVTFYMYPTAFPGYCQILAFRGESHFVFGSRLVTYLLLPRVARVVIPKFGCLRVGPRVLKKKELRNKC